MSWNSDLLQRLTSYRTVTQCFSFDIPSLVIIRLEIKLTMVDPSVQVLYGSLLVQIKETTIQSKNYGLATNWNRIDR